MSIVLLTYSLSSTFSISLSHTQLSNQNHQKIIKIKNQSKLIISLYSIPLITLETLFFTIIINYSYHFSFASLFTSFLVFFIFQFKFHSSIHQCITHNSIQYLHFHQTTNTSFFRIFNTLSFYVSFYDPEHDVACWTNQEQQNLQIHPTACRWGRSTGLGRFRPRGCSPTALASGRRRCSGAVSTWASRSAFPCGSGPCRRIRGRVSTTNSWLRRNHQSGGVLRRLCFCGWRSPSSPSLSRWKSTRRRTNRHLRANSGRRAETEAAVETVTMKNEQGSRINE